MIAPAHAPPSRRIFFRAAFHNQRQFYDHSSPLGRQAGEAITLAAIPGYRLSPMS